MARGETRIWLRICAAAAFYTGALFAIYIVTGPLRAVRLDPTLGATAGAVVESGLFMPVILFGGTMIPAVFRLTNHPRALLATGLIALALFLIADIVVGIFLCGLSPAEHLSRFLHESGWVQAGALAVFTIFPWLWWRADKNRPGIYAASQPARGFSRSGP
jgi:hypothetical protein